MKTALFISLCVLSIISTAQNVGIGTTSPLFKLDVRNGSINTDSVYRIGTMSVLAAPGNNLFIGKESGKTNTTGNANTVSGYQALYSNTTGSRNIAIGTSALFSQSFNNGGAAWNSDNVAIGYEALFANQPINLGGSGIWNTAVGSLSLRSNTTGYQNTANGYESLFSNNTGMFNTAIGAVSLHSNIDGDHNTASGAAALYSNTVGNKNTANGYEALITNNSGSQNTAVGFNAAGSNSTGFQNTALGANSLVNNTTGNYNTAIGFNTGPNNNNWMNTTCLGIDATATGTDMVRIGNIFVNSIGGQVGWSTLSDGRLKLNINENVPGLRFVMNLRPVTYTLNVEGFNKSLGIKTNEQHTGPGGAAAASNMIRSGFIAQEVEKTALSLGYNFSGIDAPKNDKDLYGLRYAEFVVPIVKAMQEQQAIINELKTEIDLLKTALEKLKRLN